MAGRVARVARGRVVVVVTRCVARVARASRRRPRCDLARVPELPGASSSSWPGAFPSFRACRRRRLDPGRCLSYPACRRHGPACFRSCRKCRRPRRLRRHWRQRSQSRRPDQACCREHRRPRWGDCRRRLSPLSPSRRPSRPSRPNRWSLRSRGRGLEDRSRARGRQKRHRNLLPSSRRRHRQSQSLRTRNRHPGCHSWGRAHWRLRPRSYCRCPSWYRRPSCPRARPPRRRQELRRQELR